MSIRTMATRFRGRSRRACEVTLPPAPAPVPGASKGPGFPRFWLSPWYWRSPVLGCLRRVRSVGRSWGLTSCSSQKAIPVPLVRGSVACSGVKYCRAADPFPFNDGARPDKVVIRQPGGTSSGRSRCRINQSPFSSSASMPKCRTRAAAASCRSSRNSFSSSCSHA